jgi:ATP-dependent DNA helicase PIF1
LRYLAGQTIHSWAGVTGSERTVSEALKRIRSSPHSLNRWRETKVLITDESRHCFFFLVIPPQHLSVSLLDADYFDILEAVGRELLDKYLPFGGIQVNLSVFSFSSFNVL